MLERHWKYYPAIKIALPFAAGIVAAKICDPSIEASLLFLLGALCWMVSAMRGASLVAPLTLVILFSGMLASIVGDDSELVRLRGAMIRDGVMVGRIVSGPVFKAGRIEYRVECDSVGYRNSVAHPGVGAILRLYDSTRFDPELLPRIGDHISAVGTIAMPDRPPNPGAFDYSAYLRSQGIGLTMSVARVASIHIFERDALTLFERMNASIGREVRAFADLHVRGEEGDIVRALLIGERDYIDLETRREFIRTGTIHLLSVSGLHVGVIAMILFVAVSWLRNRWMQLAAFVLMIGAYSMIAGGGASIMRASLMASAVMLARVAGRLVRPLNTLGVAFLAILLIAPDQLFDVGFQLSFASVAGIILIYGPCERALADRFGWLRRYSLVRSIVQLFLLSFSAQLFTLPFVLYHFGYLSVVALLVNIPAVPLYSIALGAALAGTIVAPIIPFVADCLGGSAHLTLSIAGAVVSWGADLPFTGLELGTITLLGAMLLGLALLYLSFFRTLRQASARMMIVAMVIIGVYLHNGLADPLSSSRGPLLFMLKGNRGVLIGATRRDTLDLYIGDREDSSAAAQSGEALRMRIGAGAVRVMMLNDSTSIGAEMTVNDSTSIAAKMMLNDPTSIATKMMLNDSTSIVAKMMVNDSTSLAAEMTLNDGKEIASDSESMPSARHTQMLLLNERPREVVLPDLPVLLSYTTLRPYAMVSMQQMRLLQIPMRAGLDEAIVLRYRNGWEPIEWR